VPEFGGWNKNSTTSITSCTCRPVIDKLAQKEQGGTPPIIKMSSMLSTGGDDDFAE